MSAARLEPFRMLEVTLSGTPRERGRIHGESLRSEIAQTVGEVVEVVAEAASENGEAILRLMGTREELVGPVRRWTPELVEEVVGIAEGAGLDYELVMGYQCLEETPRWTGTHSESSTAFACTTLGSFPKSGPTILAQTADNPVWIDGVQTILHIHDAETGTQAHVLTFPGIVGAYGLNSHGVGICINEMTGRMRSARSGLSAPFVTRGVLACRSVADAEKFIRAILHPSGHNYTVGGPGRVVALECSAGGVVPYVPEGKAWASYHTNHPLANDDRVEDAGPPESSSSSETRFASVQRRMSGDSLAMTWKEARAILSSHDDETYPICSHRREGRPSMTCFGIVMECASEPVLHLSSGPPCFTEFRDFRFCGPVRTVEDVRLEVGRGA